MNKATVALRAKTASFIRPVQGILQRKCACGNHSVAGGECAECEKKKNGLQRKLTIGASNDPLEQEADRVADQVMAAPAHSQTNVAPPCIQRFRSQGNERSGITAPDSVDRALSSSGRPLEPALQHDMGQRFGHDFSQVRVHTDNAAEQSARDVNALAYTVGHDVVFGSGQLAPETQMGRRLIAHELTHVLQQAGVSEASIDQNGQGSGLATLSNARIVSRASPDAVGYTMRLGRTAQTGIQFSPTNVTDTRVGPVTVQGGLLSGGASRLNVIIGENLSLRALARQLLPLWTTATPFTPSGAVAPLPLDIITEDELAQGLLVYNQTYLPVPALTNWRSGLRFPLPIEIDELTGVATLHPLQIRALASAFDPTWTPLLDLRAPGIAAAPATTTQADVTAFLGRETTVLARGIHLGARALTNAVAELPFIRETFRQLGAASFDVALAFMDNLVNREISLLAAQRDGAAILAEIHTALAAAPAIPTAAQQASLTRANLMLGLVAGVAAQAPPGAARTRAEKTITVDTVKLDGSSHNPSTDIAMASSILSQCNVRVRHGVNVTATNPQTTGWLGGNTDLRSGNNCNSPSQEERALFRDARAAFGFNARFSAFFAATVSGISASGYSCNPSDGMAPLFRNKIVVLNSGDTATLAHELGHILIDLGPHTAAGLMSARPATPAMRLPQVSAPHCTRLYNNA